MSTLKRVDGRGQSEMRPFKITAGTNPYAEGSAEVQLGSTRILITATIDRLGEQDIKTGLGGRIMTSVSMLPRSTHLRVEDATLAEALQAELQSMQSLIGRSLRAAVAEKDMSRIALTVDCCVACSDAGIAAASVAGSWVATYQAMRWAALNNLVDTTLYINQIAGLSGGQVNGICLLDLCAEEAKSADFVVNFVFDEKRELVDLRAGAEGKSLSVDDFSAMLSSASQHIDLIFKEQERAVLELQ